MPQKHWKAAITLEHDLQGPQTLRTDIMAGTARKAISMAVKQALQAAPRKRWTSLVVLLEKVEAEAIRTGPSGETVESSDLRA